MQNKMTKADNYIELYTKLFDINKIKVHPKKRVWELYIKPKALIDVRELESIESELAKKYTLTKVKLIISQEADISRKTGNIEECKDDIMTRVINDNPGFIGFLKDSSIKCYEDNKIHIILSSKISYDYLKQKKLDQLIERIALDQYGIEASVILSYIENSLGNDDYIDSLIEEERKIIDQTLKSVDKKPTELKDKQETKNKVIYGKLFSDDTISFIDNLNEESGRVVIKGKIFHHESKVLNNGKKILNIYVTDYTNSIICKMFLKEEDDLTTIGNMLSPGSAVKIKGDVQLDPYSKEIVLYPIGIMALELENRMDTALVKRVELHAHTSMSAMDGVASATALIKKAKDWGHKAIAITDHGVVQAFPEAYEASKKYGVKVLYGVEGYLVDDGIPIVYNEIDYSFDDEYVVFDIETTGLNNVNDKITEIGAVLIKDRKVISKFNSLINPKIPIPEKIQKLTGITDEMVSDAPSIEEVLPQFLDFVGDRPLVAHNAMFDVGFIRQNAFLLGMRVNNPVLDTLQLSRNLVPINKHKLNILCDHFGIKLENHHRASDDAEAAALVLIELFKLLEEKNIKSMAQINSIIKEGKNLKTSESYHIIILVKNHIGLLNLYKLISVSHLDYFYKKPRILKSVLLNYKEGLIIGSACEAGEIYRSILNNVGDSVLFEKAKLYDYFEVQPLSNNDFMVRNGTIDRNGLIEINKKIYTLGKKMNKPVVATGDVHFLEPQDEVFRRILMAGQGYSDADDQAPLYFKTTDEMLEDFSYFGSDIAYEIVVENPNKIADEIEEIIPIPEETFPPKIDGADEQIREMTMKKAHSIYGEELPPIVKARLDKELNSIINNGYAVLYLIAHKLVTKSMKDGYLVGSRGSVGSSFVATMCDITEVNPLPPHYVCEKCKYSYFYTDGSIGSGADLPDKDCPVCGNSLKKDGHDIPFEIFLGFEGDKEPDIDLNFAGEYQPIAHKYTEELFGEGHVFRAGTIGTIAEKTAYGFVKKYFESKGKKLNSAEAKRLIDGCTGIKRTTGQHPGGVMIVPSDKEIYEFTPIQHPADDADSSVITTHFDYHSISGRLLKLDILGHDVPTIIRMLEDITGVPAQSIKLDDKKTMSLFTSTEALGISLEDIDCKVGSLGIPEFGTKFVRQMLMDTKPSTFAELLRISGLSHGTDVWLNNAQDIIRSGKATLKDVISTRDDIMLYLIYKGVQPKLAFKTAESVRKGKGLSPESEAAMIEKGVPDWYINSCKTIKYLFPKAHATAYVMMSFRIAYYKVYYPEAFYATYFTVRLDDFDADMFTKGKDLVKLKWIELDKLGNNATTKEKNLMTLVEVVYEMYCRGIKLLPVDLYKSEADKFVVTDEGIRPPLRALQGLGANAAISIVKERNKCPFISIEDLRERTKISKTVIEIMRNHGCLDGLPENNQLSLF
ncbi:PolC-type DNA polymerase III [Lutispora thermophila]|uniref:DNA polymerase III PolC-type n=1 Tax=Lutispora thermophila DSM 19022 TaxID=1122184 RepID=A0A1M6I4K1_9FIRM|nr:PolC-type DNA polymerase III [Lutispora thermophila]SHJ29396.1 DNA polymerase-3 subunit alpha [Lutispora thermophila DSM 19022]